MPPRPGSRPAISDNSLLHVPVDAIDGYKERLEECVDWTLLENAAKHHRKKCDYKTEVSFEEAIIRKLETSIWREFLDEESPLTLDQSWELSLPIKLWEIEKFADDAAVTCFEKENYITDDLVKIIKKTVKHGDRRIINRELKKVKWLRLIDCKVTKLDSSLSKYRNLKILNLCGNYLSRIETQYLPEKLEILELSLNKISSFSDFTENFPRHLSYLGLGRNILTNVSHDAVTLLRYVTILDLSDNEIYDLDPALETLSRLRNLFSLSLIGNPCSVCSAYAIRTMDILPNLGWLDNRRIYEVDRPKFKPEIQIDDLRTSRFIFTVLRVMSVPPPPKTEKGITVSFYVELEIPLLDSKRRQFLMYRRNESLIETVAPTSEMSSVRIIPDKTKSDMISVAQSNHQGLKSSTTKLSEEDIYKLTAKNSEEIFNYTIFESNKVQWNKIMTFQVPTVKIFCPDLRALRDTFRSEITVRLICSMCHAPKQTKVNKKNPIPEKLIDQYCTLAVIKFSLENPDWNKQQQYFAWDNEMNSEYAEKTETNLSHLQYFAQNPVIKTTKGKSDNDLQIKREIPENLTCHFGFGIDTIRA